MYLAENRITKESKEFHWTQGNDLIIDGKKVDEKDWIIYEKDDHITDVIFRVDTTKDFKGVVYALFPHEVNDSKGSVLSYQHVGQHSSADYQHCIRKSKLASETQYKELKRELEHLGYNLRVVRKQNYTKFLESYHKSKN